MGDGKPHDAAPPSSGRSGEDTLSLDTRTRARLGFPEAVTTPHVLGDRFELLEQLGEGGMGVVYRAHDRLSGEAVAIKLLRAHRDHDGGRTAERFRRELRAARSVTHPGVVRIHELFAFEGHLALSMQLVDGETLDARLKREGALSADAVIRLTRELAEGLACAHAEGVVHRDLKPSNILLRRDDGRAMISDFGISRITQVPEAQLNMGGHSSPFPHMTHGVLGTPAYMAPEQLVDAATADERADIFTLGVVLFEAATGRLPHPETPGDGAPVRTVPSRDAFPAGLPAWLVDIVLRCLQLEPAARFANGLQLEAAIHAADRRSPEPSRPRQRRTIWAVAAVAVAFSVAVLVSHRSTALPARDRRVHVVVSATPGVSELVRRATERLAQQRLDARALAFTVVPDAAEANVRITLKVRPREGAIWLEPAWGPTEGDTTSGQPVRGNSVRSALDTLLPKLLDVLSAGQGLRQPSPHERRALDRFELDSLEQLVAYNVALEALFEREIKATLDEQAIVENLLRVAPGWARAHLVCEISRRADGVMGLPDELPPLDRSRDPQGVRLLESVRLFYRGDTDGAARMQSALYRELPDDLLTGTIYASTLGHEADKLQEHVAVLRGLHARWPHFMFGSWIAAALPTIGRENELPAFVERWLAHAPESQALLEAIALHSRQNASDVDALIDDYLQLQGAGDLSLAGVSDMLLSSGRYARATELAELLLVSNEALGQNYARRRLGDLALLDGRFDTGRKLLEQAVDASDPQGRWTELRANLSARMGLAEFLGERQAAAAHARELAQILRAGGQPTLATVFESVMGTPDSNCAALVQRAASIQADAADLAHAHAARYLAARGCAPCDDVVRRGLLPVESLQGSLYAFGECALASGDARLAREAFRRASVLQTSMTMQFETLASPVHAVLAWYGLGRAHEALEDPGTAQQAYEHFVTRWKGAERPVPQLEDARRRLQELRSSPP